jgi:hypothetical protein
MTSTSGDLVSQNLRQCSMEIRNGNIATMRRLVKLSLSSRRKFHAEICEPLRINCANLRRIQMVRLNFFRTSLKDRSTHTNG